MTAPSDSARRSDDLGAFETRMPARFRIATSVRFSDLDPNNHVNHARYLAYFEECRLAFRRHLQAELGLLPTLSWPIGVVTVRYLRSLSYPMSLTVELAPLHVGRSSFSLGYGLFDDRGCAATAMSRSVCRDTTTGLVTAMPAVLADRLRQLMPSQG